MESNDINSSHGANVLNHKGILKYEINETVYVHERSQIYLAKVIKTRFQTLSSVSSSCRNKKNRKNSLKQIQLEQKILQNGPFWEYYVHFNGWGKSHDKWCEEEVIMKDNEESRELAAISKEREKIDQIKRKEKKIIAKSGKRKQTGSNSMAQSGKKRKKNLDIDSSNGTEVCQPIHKNFAEYCTLPFTLQAILVDDRTNIKRLGRHVAMGYDEIPKSFEKRLPSMYVHKLPVMDNITVASIMKGFLKFKENQQSKFASNDAGDVNEVIPVGIDGVDMNTYALFCDDMVQLFDSFLPKYLLYSEEKGQFKHLLDRHQQSGASLNTNNSDCTHKFSMATVYGGEFLLRLLVRLPLLLTTIDNATITSLKVDHQKWRLFYEKDNHKVGQMISELILFLQKNSKKCFKGNYELISI